MKRWIASVVVVGLLLVPSNVSAGDAPGCEGLEAFKADVFAIGEAWADDLDEAGISTNRNPVTYSSDDWRTFADIALTYNRALRDVDAPDWLQDWLQVKIERTGLQEQVGKVIADGGILLILGFDKQFSDIETREGEIVKQAIARCPDFAQFAHDWDALDGEVDGTPVAKPAH